ncbi:DUF1801 domain-containing protein [Devosia sp.]|uniref:DUF1801 domain-containing protein n=1 Tax=Devosia sp. TaxID=1871048 RepID=UPI003A8E0BE4
MAETNIPPMPEHVAAAFDAFPQATRSRLLALRDMVFSVAAETEGVGPLSETLKWGEPAYLTDASRSGTTLRLGVTRTAPENCAIFVNCQTSLVELFRTHYADTFGFEGNRALVLAADAPLPEAPLRHCIAATLTYHRWK